MINNINNTNENLKSEQEIVQNQDNEQLKERKKEEKKEINEIIRKDNEGLKECEEERKKEEKEEEKKENQNKIFSSSSGNNSEKIEILNINKEKENLNQIVFNEEITIKNSREPKKKFNIYEEVRKMYDELSEVDKYYNNFMECLHDVAQYKILDDETTVNLKNIDSNISRKIKVYSDYEILKKNRIYATFFKMYVEFRRKREKFRNLLDYVKDLKYLEKIIKEEKEILKYLFGFLENLIRCYNRNNSKFVGGVNLEYFNPNNEFYHGEHYDSKCEYAYPVKFKYDVYDVIKNFYDVEIKNLEENLVGVEKLKLKNIDEKMDLEKERELNYAYEALSKKNELYYKFIAYLNFDAIFRRLELLRQLFNEIDYEIKFKNEEEKFFKLQFMFRKLRNHVRLLFQNIFKSDEMIYYLKNEEGMLRKIYDLIIDFLPNYLKEKEKFINAEIESFNDKELEEIKNYFRRAVLKEMVRVKNEPVSFKKMCYYYDKKFPLIFSDYEWENSNKNAVSINFNSVIDDVNFNSIFEKIDYFVDEYGNSKKPIKQQNKTENKDSILFRLYKNLNELVEFYLDGVFKFHERLK